MPRKDVKDVQELRQAHKKRVKKYPVSTVYLQVIGSGAPGAPASLYVSTDHCRYLFNCGEGSQRLAYEHKVKLSMMEHIFFTHKSWKNVGGLPGLLLTLQDTGVPEMALHGPPGIELLHHDTKNFMRFSDLKLGHYHYKESNESSFDVGPLSIKVVSILSENEREIEIPDELTNCSVDPVGELFGRQNASEVESSSNDLTEQRVNELRKESIKYRDLCLAYICRPAPKPGSLRFELCKKLGVPVGPLMGQLKDGKDITLPNGKIVKAEDVNEPPDNGTTFIVLEVSTKDHIPSLVSEKTFHPHMEYPNSKEEDIAQIVVHFSPSDVVEDERYQRWMNQFPSTTLHIMLNEKSTCMGSERVHKIQYKLNHIYPKSFPLLADGGIPQLSCDKRIKYCDDTEVMSSNSMQNGTNKEFSSNVKQGFTLLSYHIRPNTKLDLSNRCFLDTDGYVKECYTNPKFSEVLSEVKAQVELKSSCNSNSEEPFPKIVFLGTGSCIPNKTRNTSGILVHINEEASLIMDSGEGTYGQIVRLFGYEEAKLILKKLKAIYVSHLHADHHIGLIQLLLKRRLSFCGVINRPKLYLLAPAGIIHYLNSFHVNFEEVLTDVVLIPNHNINAMSERANVDLQLVEEIRREVSSVLALKTIETCFVRHCPSAFGVSITFNDGFKVVYSGDTMPSDNLISIGADCDLLIHEATMEDELKEDAILKRHSTTSDAIDVAVKMAAKSIILTHFSQRYAKVPLLKGEITSATNVTLAFDNMVVCRKDLQCLPLLNPVFIATFSEDYKEMTEKSAKRKRDPSEKIVTDVVVT